MNWVGRKPEETTPSPSSRNLSKETAPNSAWQNTDARVHEAEGRVPRLRGPRRAHAAARNRRDHRPAES